jgi:hypothetical protein
VTTFAAHVDSSAEYSSLTMVALMSGSFGGLALLIALVGISGVTAYAVSRVRVRSASASPWAPVPLKCFG